jgi:hypothetical protein
LDKSGDVAFRGRRIEASLAAIVPLEGREIKSDGGSAGTVKSV